MTCTLRVLSLLLLLLILNLAVAADVVEKEPPPPPPSSFATICKQRLKDKGLWTPGRWHFPTEDGPAPTEDASTSKWRDASTTEWRVVWLNNQAGCSAAAAQNGIARSEVGAFPRLFKKGADEATAVYSGRCEAVVEWDFLFDVVLKDVKPPVSEASVIAPNPFGIDTLTTFVGSLGVLVERGIYVVHAAMHSSHDTGAVKVLQDRARVRELGEALAICGATSSVLVHLSDESASLDSFYEPWPLVLRQYFSPALARRWSKKLLFIPLGYASGFKVPRPPQQQQPSNRQCETQQCSAKGPVSLLPSSQRRWGWTFIGDIGNFRKPTRRQFFYDFTKPDSPLGPAVVSSINGTAMPNVPQHESRFPAGGFCHVTDRTTGYPDQWEYSDTMWPAKRIASVLANASFCPAPMGFTSTESYRFWEAVEAGCLPIIDAIETNVGKPPAFMVPAFEPSRMDEEDELYFDGDDDRLHNGLSSYYYDYHEGAVVHHPQYFRYFLSHAAMAYKVGDGSTGLRNVPRFFFEVGNNDWNSTAFWVAEQLDMLQYEKGNHGKQPVGRGVASAETEGRLDRRQSAMLEWWTLFKSGISRTVASRLAALPLFSRWCN